MNETNNYEKKKKEKPQTPFSDRETRGPRHRSIDRLINETKHC